jgi:hypothetical protein
MEMATNEITGLEVVNVEVISEDNVELGQKVLDCTFRKLEGTWRSYKHSFSTIKNTEEIYNNDDIITIDLDEGYELLVNKVEYEAFKGEYFDEYHIYQEAKRVIFSYPIQFKARVVYTLGGEVGYKLYDYKELNAGYPAYYLENEIEELEECIKEKALQLFEKDFVKVN